jgi:hypothetical protein
MRNRSVLLLYAHPLRSSAPTIMEHVDSYDAYSRFRFVPLNTSLGFPLRLRNAEFQAIVLHYSLFGSHPFSLSERFRQFIREADCPKVAFFQDEHQHCVERMQIVNDLGVSVIYSLLDPPVAKSVYGPRTKATHIEFTLTGFVSDDLIRKGEQYAKPRPERRIDVGYRGRVLSRLYGQGGQEKIEIAHRFRDAAAGKGFVIDIGTSEADRIYGDDWYRFVGDCRFTLGVAAGVSIFDLDGEVSSAVATARRASPGTPLEEIYAQVLPPFENRITYRTISPRIFEALAFRTGLILYEGTYQGVIRPWDHYLPLRKDFSNIDEILRCMRDETLVSQMLERGYEEVIRSDRWHYRTAIRGLDDVLVSLGLRPEATVADAAAAREALASDEWLRRVAYHARQQVHQVDFPGRRFLVASARRLGVIPPRR